jgi:hypothetical protein
MKSAAETYFAALVNIHATGGGVQETSYYPALINLFNAVSETSMAAKMTGEAYGR